MANTVSAYEVAALAKVPYKMLTKISEDPDYVQLSKLRREVYRNCAAVPSALNENNGYLGLLMPAAQYQAKNGGNPYIASPNYPGTYNNTIAANTGRVLQSRREATHKLKEAMPRWLLAEIEDRDNGLNNVNIQDIFDHAFDCRGQIDDVLVNDYTTTFSSPLDMSQ
eukprot:9518034-Ditylum_brightwellii.AAC.1